MTNEMKVRSIIGYKELQEDLKQNVTNILCNLYAKGYNHDGNLKKCIHESNLDFFLSWSNIVRYLDVRKFFKTYLMQILQTIR